MLNESLFTPVTLQDGFEKTISQENTGTTTSATEFPSYQTKGKIQNVALHDANFAFYTTTLQKLHNTVYEPLTYVTYKNDIYIEAGKGFVDYIAYYSVDYAGIMAEMRNVIGNNTNYIPRINAGLSRNQVPVYTWSVAYDLRFIDLEKMKTEDLAKSIEEIYKSGITAGWDLFVQSAVYTGFGTGKGLFNSDDVVEKITIDNSKTTGEGFEGMDDEVVVSFFNGIFEHYLEGSNMNVSILPDTILVPTFVGKDLSSRYSSLYTSTLREFIKSHNLGIDESEGTKFSVTIASRPALNTLGAAGKGRIVAYRKDAKFARADMPYPLQHYMTQPNIDKAAYTSIFVGQISAVQLPYNHSAKELGVVTYYDFTTSAVGE